MSVSADEFAIHFGGSRVRFSSAHADLLAALGTHFRHCLDGAGSISSSYIITTFDESHFDVSLDGGDLFSQLTREQVLFHLMQDTIPRLNGSASLGPVIHAAALTHLDRGLILCGESGCGKSTLTAWLAAHGYHYLTDEVICLEDGFVSGLPRSIVLKRGSAFVWQRWLGNLPDDGCLQFADGTTWIDPSLFGAEVCQRVAPRVLVFPRYVPETGLRVEPLKPADALFRLLHGLVNARNFADGGLAAASRLAKQVRAWQITYSDLESVTTWLGQTLAD
ncbi:MAG: hypothetical protein HY869_13750 [Chloroflexi bacterium]|nr:hypothetical protein [Chloroflexota bacterium]